MNKEFTNAWSLTDAELLDIATGSSEEAQLVANSKSSDGHTQKIVFGDNGDAYIAFEKFSGTNTMSEPIGHQIFELSPPARIERARDLIGAAHRQPLDKLNPAITEAIQAIMYRS